LRDFIPFDFTPSVPDFRTACNGSIANHGTKLWFDLGRGSQNTTYCTETQPSAVGSLNPR